MYRCFIIFLMLLLLTPVACTKIEFPGEVNIGIVDADTIAILHGRFAQHDGNEYFQLTNALVGPGEVVASEPPQEFKIIQEGYEDGTSVFVASFEKDTISAAIEGIYEGNRIIGLIDTRDTSKKQQAHLLMFGKVGTVDDMVKVEPEFEAFWRDVLLKDKEHSGQLLIDKFLHGSN